MSIFYIFLNKHFRIDYVCFMITFYKLLFIDSREREEEVRERHWFAVPLIYVFIGWLLYVPWLGIEPQPWCIGTTLTSWTLTKWAGMLTIFGNSTTSTRDTFNYTINISLSDVCGIFNVHFPTLIFFNIVEKL